jgi:hypothetical protein
MSPFDLSSGQSGRVGLTPAIGSADVQWIRPAGTPDPWMPPPPSSSARDRTDQVQALIVIVLTLACTALALFDLFLLASGL